MSVNLNQLPSELAAVVGVIDPDAYSNAKYATDWIDMAKWESIMAIAMIGDMVSTSTAVAKLEQATTSGGAGKKDVTGKTATTLTQAGTDDNKQVVINCRQEDLDVANSFRYVRLNITIGTAGSDMSGLILGFFPRYNVASDSDVATVDEIV